MVCIGLATVIEKYRGTPFVSAHIYGAWWFSVLWTLLTVTACAYIMKQRLYKRLAVFLLHLSFVVILAGALTTHLFAKQGTVTLRTGIAKTNYVTKNGGIENFPFSLNLKEFRIATYPGTDAPLDYQSIIQVESQESRVKGQGSRVEGQGARGEGQGSKKNFQHSSFIFHLREQPVDKTREVTVSMNNIGHIDGYRLFQQSYDSDGEGVTLGVSYDPWGIAITYTGYLLLLIGIIATLFSKQAQMRALYRQATTAVFLILSITATAATGSLPSAPSLRSLSSSSSLRSLPSSHSLCRGAAPFPGSLCRGAATAPPSSVRPAIARRMGAVSVLYNSRICPLNTVATDFVTKLSGSASWNGYSADEIFVSWMIYYSPWERQKLIRVKSRDIQQLLGIDSQWASYSDFLNQYHEYKLQDAVEALRTGHSTYQGFPLGKIRKALLDADEKFHLVEMFYRGQFLRIFPYCPSSSVPPHSSFVTRHSSFVTWYAPGSQSLPKEIPVKEQFFIKQSMDFLSESIVTGQDERAFEIIAKIRLFQRHMIGDLLPSEGMTRTEIFYNTLRSQKWPIFMALSLSLLLCIVTLVQKQSDASFLAPTQPSQGRVGDRPFLRYILLGFNSLFFAYLTLLLGLRWWLCGHIPVSNGHETMLFMAWMLLLLTFMLHRKFTIIMAFGPLAASFCLLVAMLAGSNSQLTPLMPVLQSPLLSIHVMTVMIAYALFALQVLLGCQALIMIKKNLPSEKITALSRFLLYPAVFLLTVGIFLGAVWANVSWGSYWSWDPKESWALITLMIYAVPFHSTSLPLFRKPLYYHLYMICSFLTVIITYFGVNYLLGGMHSYA